MTKLFTRIAPFVFCLVALPALAGERLVVVGGGNRDAEAMKRFVDWAGGANGRIVYVPWATSVPDESLAGFVKDVEPHGAKVVEMLPLAPLTPEKAQAARAMLAAATGVFFSGGDQAKHMAAFAEAPELLALVRERFRAGVVMGGTSAGAAVMSDPMITGEGDFTVLDGDKVETKPGLGLLPGVIVDQHFVKRQRQNRLFGLVLKHGLPGLGVDEDTAALVTDSRVVEAVGAGSVWFVEGRPGPAFRLEILRPGDRFDLQTRQRLP